MSVIVILILASLLLALLFLGGFVWAVRSGQFEDTFTPSMRVLTDESSGSVQGKNISAGSGSTLLRSAPAATTNNGGSKGTTTNQHED